ncbi:MAG: VPLPA-CTERM sorting domain-containing protein [Pseudomonadota bacterium]
MIRLTAAIASVFLLLPAAHAATITYNGAGAPYAYKSKTETSGGVSVTTSVGTWSNSGAGQGSVSEAGGRSIWIHEGSWGVAVQNYEERRRRCWYQGWYCYSSYSDTHQIDGKGVKEAVIFSFDEQVSLDSLTFNTRYLHNRDDFVLFAGNSVNDLTSFSLFRNAKGAANSAGTFALGIVGKVFAIGGYDANDAFKLTALNYSQWSTPTPTPVPGALPLMLTALGGFGFMRRRKSAA